MGCVPAFSLDFSQLASDIAYSGIIQGKKGVTQVLHDKNATALPAVGNGEPAVMGGAVCGILP